MSERYTPEQLSEQAQRTLSDAELIKDGARYEQQDNQPPHLVATEEQVNAIRSEMNADLLRQQTETIRQQETTIQDLQNEIERLRQENNQLRDSQQITETRSAIGQDEGEDSTVESSQDHESQLKQEAQRQMIRDINDALKPPATESMIRIDVLNQDDVARYMPENWHEIVAEIRSKLSEARDRLGADDPRIQEAQRRMSADIRHIFNPPQGPAEIRIEVFSHEDIEPLFPNNWQEVLESIRQAVTR